MNQPSLGSLLLRLRLALLRANPLTLAAACLLLAVSASLAWVLHAASTLDAERAAWQAQNGHALAAAASAAASAATSAADSAAPDNLARFYATLGQRSEAEQQVQTLFHLAAQNGLTLAQGDYKIAYERNAQIYTYQVTLPVKGGYEAIWQFAMGALRAIPFAALDDIGFRRDAIGDPQVEARLRLTFYLADKPAGAKGAGTANASADHGSAAAGVPADAAPTGSATTLAARGAGAVG